LVYSAKTLQDFPPLVRGSTQILVWYYWQCLLFVRAYESLAENTIKTKE